MKKYSLYLLAILVGVCLVLGEKGVRDKHESFKEMLEAKNLMIKLSKVIYLEKVNRGINMNRKLDILESGLIGEEFTGITTTLGDLDSKRLSTNPEFAAYFVKKLKNNRVEKGDIVYVNMSSSFPGLNLSLISALDTLNLRGVIINSIGSSMYGANNEEFTFLEMIDFLKSKKMIKNSIDCYTLGGDGDEGLNFDEMIKKQLIERLKGIDINKLDFKNLNENIEKRISYYEKYPNPKYFINIGGNLVSAKLEKYYKSLGVPTLTMLNIKQIALANGISNVKETNYLYEKSQNLIFYFGILFIFMGYILSRVYNNNKNTFKSLKKKLIQLLHKKI